MTQSIEDRIAEIASGRAEIPDIEIEKINNGSYAYRRIDLEQQAAVAPNGSRLAKNRRLAALKRLDLKRAHGILTQRPQMAVEL